MHRTTCERKKAPNHCCYGTGFKNVIQSTGFGARERKMLYEGSRSTSTTCSISPKSSGLASQKARETLPARRNGIQSLLLVRHPVIPELSLQPLPRARLDPIAIDQFRVIVRAQEEYRRVSRGPRRRRIGTVPGDDAVETRGQSEAGEEFQRVADVDDGAVGAGRDGLPCFGSGGVGLEAPVAVEEDGEAAGVGVGEVADAGVGGEVGGWVVLQCCDGGGRLARSMVGFESVFVWEVEGC